MESAQLELLCCVRIRPPTIKFKATTLISKYNASHFLSKEKVGRLCKQQLQRGRLARACMDGLYQLWLEMQFYWTQSWIWLWHVVIMEEN